jgi:hypothetical protein
MTKLNKGASPQLDQTSNATRTKYHRLIKFFNELFFEKNFHYLYDYNCPLDAFYYIYLHEIYLPTLSVLNYRSLWFFSTSNLHY